MGVVILKPGKKPIDVKHFVCPRCGCEFEADSESYHATSQTMATFEGLNYECERPTCGKMVYIS